MESLDNVLPSLVNVVHCKKVTDHEAHHSTDEVIQETHHKVIVS